MELLHNLAVGFGVALTPANLGFAFIGAMVGTLIGVGAIATPILRPLETFIAALVLIALSWAIFIVGLGLTIPVWPEW